MHYESLDPDLETGVASLCHGDWNTARDCLSRRLDESARLGMRRLNLFLLSVAATRSGQSAVGEQLAEMARSTPAEMGEPRHLGDSDDPLRRQLEEAWWRFNDWNPEPPGAMAAAASEPAGGLDWPAILDGALEGRAGELERRWSRYLDGDHPQRGILWNLVALGYLESGDPRTYEEMRAQAPRSTGEVPAELAMLLEGAGLFAALEDLRAGRWLSSHTLLSTGASGETSRQLAGQTWEAEMEESFSLLSVGRGVEAARKLGPLTLLREVSPLRRAYSLNALAVALFSSGEYGAAEEALRDGHAEAEGSDLGSEPELAARYAHWLESCGFRPLASGSFCDPFADSPSTSHGEGPSVGAEEMFWSGFEEALDGLRDGNLGSVKRTLGRLVSEPGSQETTRGFLLALLFAGTALLEGDHMDAQESIDDASRLLERGGLDDKVLVEARGRLAAAGAIALASKMDRDQLRTLDPWRDFPADFPQQSLHPY